MDENTAAIEVRLHRRSGLSCPRSPRVLLVWLVVGLWAASSIADAPIAPGDDYGNGITLNRTSDLVDVVANPGRYQDGPILVKGRISEVCQHKGCWTVLSVGGSNLKVNMRDHAFSIPTDCSGRQAFVEGVLAKDTACGDDSAEGEHVCRHAEAAGGGQNGRGPQSPIPVPVSLNADGVRLVAAD